MILLMISRVRHQHTAKQSSTSTMASPAKPLAAAPIFLLFLLLLAFSFSSASTSTEDPTPTVWPHQFHSILAMNYSGILQLIDLWYDWPNGRNFNIIQHQLGSVLHDLEWNNGTSFLYSLDPASGYCSTAQLEVGILRPNWLDGANYLGRRHVDGFLCNVWEKADFITYYEDVQTKRPVHWVFYTGREAHVMTFEVGAVLDDAKWQAPAHCFDKKTESDPEAEFSIAGASVDGRFLRGLNPIGDFSM